MSHPQNAAFDPGQFSSNQPAALGRNHRPDASNAAYLAHRAGIEKSNVSATKRQATRRKNLEAAQQADADPMRAVVSSSASQPDPQQQAGALGTSQQLRHPSMQPLMQPPGPRPNPLEGTAMPMAPMLPISQSAGSQTLSTAPMYQNPSSFLPQQVVPQRSFIFSGDSGQNPVTPARAPLEPIQINHQHLRPDLSNVSRQMSLTDFTNNFTRLSREEQAQAFRQLLSTQSSSGKETVPRPTGSSGWRKILTTTCPHMVSLRFVVNQGLITKSLQMQIHDVEVHRKRRRMPKQSAAPTPVVELSDSDGEQPTRKRRKKNVTKSKKRAGRKQPSRSITEVPADRQPFVKASYRHIQKMIVIKSGWPIDSPSGLPGSADDEYGTMVLDAWDDAHSELGITEGGYIGDPTDREVKLIRARVGTVRGAFKTAAQKLVAGNYGLINPQTLTDATPEKIAETIAANRAIVEKIETTFYYLNPLDDTIPDSMYRNVILQNTLNIACFGTNANRRGYYFTGMDKIPLETLALVVAAVRCAIDEWKTGRPVEVKFEFEPYAGTYKTALKHLRGWIAFAATQTIDVATPALAALLRVARGTSATAEPVEAAQELSSFSAASYAKNQPVVA
ncbi:hypothetical protein B0H12DRAFT_1075687 [Mycena haematopus]|nr:hypothetical protein B0H12DRAFT_1075687 [Mycena haematopus]